MKASMGCFLCVTAIAVLVYGVSQVVADVVQEHDPVPLSQWGGSQGIQTRSTLETGGLTGSGDYDGTEGNVLTLEWEIVTNPIGSALSYHYTYTFSGSALAGGASGVSHFTLDISDNAIDGTDLVAGVVVDPKFTVVTNGGSSTVLESEWTTDVGDLDFITGAIKFDTGGLDMEGDTYIYEFDSNRWPVWGNFLVKSKHSLPADLTAPLGTETFAANNALFELDAPDSWEHDLKDSNNWVAVPNGVPQGTILTPEPLSLAMWLIVGAFGIVAVRFSRRRTWIRGIKNGRLH